MATSCCSQNSPLSFHVYFYPTVFFIDKDSIPLACSILTTCTYRSEKFFLQDGKWTIVFCISWFVHCFCYQNEYVRAPSYCIHVIHNLLLTMLLFAVYCLVSIISFYYSIHVTDSKYPFVLGVSCLKQLASSFKYIYTQSYLQGNKHYLMTLLTLL